MKTSVPVKPFWYSDQIVWPKTVTIITTLNEEGVPNAAPVSGVIHYDNMEKQFAAFGCGTGLTASPCCGRYMT